MFKISLTKISILFIVSTYLLLTLSCKEGDKSTAALSDELKDLAYEPIPDSDLQYARQLFPSGQVQIEGFVKDGKKTGQWIEYNPEGEIQLINHFVNGMLEGTAMRMTFRNQVDLRLNYKQNQMHGPWTSYKFGKVIEQRNYKAGKLDGLVKTFDERTFKLRQEAEYKDGLQDGFFRYYDDEGNLSLEYQYKNGEKISGGIIDPK